MEFVRSNTHEKQIEYMIACTDSDLIYSCLNCLMQLITWI